MLLFIRRIKTRLYRLEWRFRSRCLKHIYNIQLRVLEFIHKHIICCIIQSSDKIRQRIVRKLHDVQQLARINVFYGPRFRKNDPFYVDNMAATDEAVRKQSKMKSTVYGLEQTPENRWTKGLTRNT